MAVDGNTESRILRVFPRRTTATPDDDMAFIGEPPFEVMRPEADEVHVSVTFTWDLAEGKRLARLWGQYYPIVKLGGPAMGSDNNLLACPSEGFEPGVYLKRGYTITSRGCPNHCGFCLVPEREGPLRLLEIASGWDVLDNNLLACPRSHVEAVLDMLAQQPKAAKFTGGIEAARVERWFAERVAGMRLDVLYLAYDRPGQGDWVRRAAEMLLNAGRWSPGTARRKIGCYILTGYDGDSDSAAMDRFEWIKSLGITPFPMFYRPPDGTKSQAMEGMKRRLRKWMRPWSIWAEKESTDGE